MVPETLGGGQKPGKVVVSIRCSDGRAVKDLGQPVQIVVLVIGHLADVVGAFCAIADCVVFEAHCRSRPLLGTAYVQADRVPLSRASSVFIQVIAKPPIYTLFTENKAPP